MKFNFARFIYIFLAFIFLGLGIIGIGIPVLPTTPFLLLASYFFARGSERFNKWFLSSSIYKRHLEDFLENKAMTLKKKLWILLPVSAMLLATGLLINNLYARIFIGLIIVAKYYYFFRHIKTIR